MHIHFQLAQQCIQISTRINSSSVHTYIFVCFTLRVILQGFVTQNATVSTYDLPDCKTMGGGGYFRVNFGHLKSEVFRNEGEVFQSKLWSSQI